MMVQKQNTTVQMLDILKENNVKATFFWVGQALEQHPELAKQEVAQGHAVGNHTWHHWYKRMDEATAKSEIERTADFMYRTHLRSFGRASKIESNQAGQVYSWGIQVI